MKETRPIRYITDSQLKLICQQVNDSPERVIRRLEQSTGWKIQVVGDAELALAETTVVGLPRRTVLVYRVARCGTCGQAIYPHESSPGRPGMRGFCLPCAPGFPATPTEGS